MKRIISNLQRRNVIKASISYAVVGFAILEAADITFPVLGITDQAIKYLLYLLIIGFPIWIIFAYIYEWTPQGFKKTENVTPEKSIHKVTDRRLNVVIVLGIVFVATLFFLDRNLHKLAPSEPTGDLAENSIAVLPFQELSGAEDYFAVGMTEDIMTEVANIQNIRVVSRLVINGFDYQGKAPAQIGEELRVKHLLVGSVRKSENSLRIGCQLIDARSGNEVWATTYDRSIEDVFKIQKDVAEQVAFKLDKTLNKPVKPNLGTSNIQAYTYFLKAKDLAKEDDLESCIESIDYYKLAIAEDPQFASAYAGIGSSIQYGLRYFGKFSGYTWDSARHYSTKAVEVDQNEIDAWRQLASYHWYNRDFDEQEKAIMKALDIDPNDLNSIFTFANLQLSTMRPAEAIRNYHKIIELEPLHASAYLNIGAIYGNYGFYERANRYTSLSYQLNNDAPLNWYNTASGLIYEGKLPMARAAIDSMIAGDSLNAIRYVNAGRLAGFFDEELARKYVFEATTKSNYDSISDNLPRLAYFLKKDGDTEFPRIVATNALAFLEDKLTSTNQFFYIGAAYCHVLLDDEAAAGQVLMDMVNNVPGFMLWKELRDDMILKGLKEEPAYQEAIMISKTRYDKGRREILQLETDLLETQILNRLDM